MYPELEHFHGSNGIGVGVRYFLKGRKSVRFNWLRHSSDSHLDSITVWTGESHVPNYHIHGEYGDPIGDIEFSSIAPTLTDIIKHPHAGDFDVEVAENIAIHKRARGSKFDGVADSLYESVIERMSKSYISNRQFSIVAKTTAEMKIFEAITHEYKKYCMTEQSTTGEVRYKLIYQNIDKNKILETIEHNANAKQPHLRVSLANGESVDTDNQTQVERDFPHDTINNSYKHRLTDLTKMVTNVTRGELNVLFVIPYNTSVDRGEVEHTLISNNVTEGAGYVKVSGITSAEQFYRVLYQNPDRTILFFDTNPKNWNSDIDIMITNISLPESKRVIEYPDSERNPPTLEFTGNVIVVTNEDTSMSDIDPVFHTNKQVISLVAEDETSDDYILSIIDNIKIAGDLSHSERTNVFDLLTNHTTNISLPMLVRGMQIASLEMQGGDEYIQIYSRTK